MDLRRRFFVGRRCPLCRESLRLWQRSSGCYRCLLTVHAPCSRELSNGASCPSLGCTGRLVRSQRRPSPWWQGVAQGAGLGFVSAGFLVLAMLGLAHAEFAGRSLPRAQAVALAGPAVLALWAWFLIGALAVAKTFEGLGRP